MMMSMAAMMRRTTVDPALRKVGAADEDVEGVKVAKEETLMEMMRVVRITIAKMMTGLDLVVETGRGEETGEEVAAAVCRRQVVLKTAQRRRAWEVSETLQRVCRKSKISSQKSIPDFKTQTDQKTVESSRSSLI